MLSNARGSHVSPGVYTKEVDVRYAVENLGSTTLGLAGETLKGPAFEPIAIQSWSDFVKVFGSTSPAKFKGTGLPKYELPYIAESYLNNSNSLLVCRALGLSGYDAGKAWALKVEAESKKYLVGILRSKGVYNIESSKTGCGSVTEETTFLVDKIEISDYQGKTLNWNCTESGNSQTVESDKSDDKATIVCYKGEDVVAKYSVSLNPADSDYICSVIGTTPSEVSSSKIYVENFYDNAYAELAGAKIVKYLKSDGIDKVSNYYESYRTPVTPWLVSALTPNADQPQVKKLFRFVTISDGADANTEVKVSIEKINPDAGTFDVVVREYSDIDSNPTVLERYSGCNLTLGDSNFIGMKIGTVDGDYEQKSSYVYVELADDAEALSGQVPCGFLGYPMFNNVFDDVNVVPVSYNRTYDDSVRAKKQYFGFSSRTGFDSDILTYKGNIHETGYDYAKYDNGGKVETGFTQSFELPKATIESGAKVKVPSVFYKWIDGYVYAEEEKDEQTTYKPADSLPEKTTSSSDKHIQVGDKYYGLNKVAKGYVVDTEASKDNYTNYTEIGKSEFKVSTKTADKVAIYDYYEKKSVDEYREFDNVKYLGKGFHLDSRIGNDDICKDLTVDGADGYEFDCVSAGNVVSEKAPMIGTASLMEDTIYEDINLRKFTVLFYGGFDGWNIHEDRRTIDDKYNAYKMGTPTAGNKVIRAFSDSSFVGKANTSDYYAYLMAYRQFANPEKYDINLFATPGIDYVNNTLLVEDVLDMITDMEDGRGGDALYIVTTPYLSKEGDALTIDEVVDNIEDADIDSSYAATYYPWVKYYDSRAKQYIALPVTKDVLRNMVEIDTKSYPWFSPAGISRGSVDCVRALSNTVLSDEDALYSAMINPVKTFAKDGVKIWGNKTMYTVDSPLNRVNVRRLMLRVKKLISQACRSLIFEQNDDTTKKQFLSIVQPILDDVKANRGISDYRITVDSSAEARDRHELPALIAIKPTPTLEYVDLTFKITPEGASFDE